MAESKGHDGLIAAHSQTLQPNSYLDVSNENKNGMGVSDRSISPMSLVTPLKLKVDERSTTMTDVKSIKKILKTKRMNIEKLGVNVSETVVAAVQMAL